MPFEITPRTPLDALVTEKSLRIVNGFDNSMLIDSMLQDKDYDASLPFKNVCAKVSSQLSDEIDSICGLLDISKRRFLEAAFIEAVQKAHRIMKDERVFESLDERSGPTIAVVAEGEGK